MSININDIKYNNPNHVFVTTGKKIEDKAIADHQPANGIIDVKYLLDGYSEIFGCHSSNPEIQIEGLGEKKLSQLEEYLQDIVGATFNTKEGDMGVTIDNIIKYTSDFYASAKTINNKSIDENCLEGFRAYSFYLEKIVLLLKKLNDAIQQGQGAIATIENLLKDENLKNIPTHQTVEEYVNSKVHELSAELYMADKAIADVMSEFESCLKYNVDTKSWDKSNCDINSTQFTRPSSLDNLRGITIAVSNANDEKDTHKITCFSELNLLNRLRYIRCYYEIVFGGDTDYQVFPDDFEKGYPCVPDIKSTTDTKATESMGGFELFYVGYLVDRDGSIDAYSSCLEAKSKAITDNIGLQSKHIEAYNQYLTFINRAAQLHNESQSKSAEAAAIAHGTHLGLTYFCGGTMRDLLEVDGVNYIVLSYTDKDGSRDELKPNSDFNYGYNHRYLLVRADEKGLKAWYNADEDGEGKDPNGKVNGTTNKLEIITAGDLSAIFKRDCNLDCQYTHSSGFSGTTFYRRAYTSSGDCPTIFSSNESDREILVWDMVPDTTNIEDLTEDILNKEAKNKYQKDYDDLTGDEKKDVIGIARAEKYLPKQLVVQEIEPDSVAQYQNYQDTGAWGEDAEAKNRVINSWTTAFSNKSEYINTAIETINTDITALRTKMDTIDSLCSTLRNRSFETKKTLVSNLRS